MWDLQDCLNGRNTLYALVIVLGLKDQQFYIQVYFMICCIPIDTYFIYIYIYIHSR
jgi:hypothetical protein